MTRFEALMCACGLLIACFFEPSVREDPPKPPPACIFDCPQHQPRPN